MWKREKGNGEEKEEEEDEGGDLVICSLWFAFPMMATATSPSMSS